MFQLHTVFIICIDHIEMSIKMKLTRALDQNCDDVIVFYEMLATAQLPHQQQNM